MKNNRKTFPKCEHLDWGNSSPQQVLENNEKLMRFRGKAIAWEMASRRELEQLFDDAIGEMEDQKYAPYVHTTQRVLDSEDVKKLISRLKNEILGKTHEETV